MSKIWLYRVMPYYHEDDNEHVFHGQANETREKELEVSVQGSEYIFK
jgi:hypothetical protein